MLSYSSYRGNISDALIHTVIDDAGIKCSGGGMIYATVESDAICMNFKAWYIRCDVFWLILILAQVRTYLAADLDRIGNRHA